MNRPAGYKIPAHTHKKVERAVFNTLETLFIKKGKVKIDFYDKNQGYLESSIVSSGDVVLLASGGHGFEMLEQTEIIEVKQGPFAAEEDKIRFNGIRNEK